MGCRSRCGVAVHGLTLNKSPHGLLLSNPPRLMTPLSGISSGPFLAGGPGQLGLDRVGVGNGGPAGLLLKLSIRPGLSPQLSRWQTAA